MRLLSRFALASVLLLMACTAPDPPAPSARAPAPAVPLATVLPPDSTPAAVPMAAALQNEPLPSAAAPSVAVAPPADVALELGQVERIAFGSCAHQTKAQPVWDAVLEFEPELFVMLGDNVYADSTEAQGLRAAYAMAATQPGFRRVRERVPFVATWDDHDYGTNDMGGEHPNKATSKAIFLEFFPAVARAIEAEEGRRVDDDSQGLYSAYTFGPPGRRVQLILLDTRYHRTSPLARRVEAVAAPPSDAMGPYVPLNDETATMLGQAQWAWLEAQLARPAEVRLLGSSIQILAEGTGWEAWSNLPYERERLLALLDDTKAQAIVLLSGDMHWAALSRVEREARDTPLYDLTSSGLTEAWHDISPNHHRVRDVTPGPSTDGAITGANFGTVEIDWPDDDAGTPTVTVGIRSEDGTLRIEQVIAQ